MPLKRRAVATCFIFKFPFNDPNQKPQVALFRRSGNVNTYRHKYAGISGSVEETDADPLDTAWRELGEETTLNKDSLRLFRKVNPFAFILKSGTDGGRGEAGIKIDWEHEGYEWFYPDAVNDSDSFEGVPRTLESFRRVWFNIDLGDAAGNTLDQGLIALQKDHESGARQLVSIALDTYIDVIRKIDISDKDRWWRNVRLAGWHLWKNGRESMGASILNNVLASLSTIDDKLSSSNSLDKGMIDNIIVALEKYARDRQATSSRTAASFQAFLEQHPSGDGPLRILTLSFSSTIASAITHVLGKVSQPVHIHVLESRPLFEGVRMAQEITAFANENKIMLDLKVHTDASVGIVARGIDIVLTGANLIDRTAAVSNKVGSLPTILTARYIAPQAKVVALSEKEKLFPFSPPGQGRMTFKRLRKLGKSSQHPSFRAPTVESMSRTCILTRGGYVGAGDEFLGQSTAQFGNTIA
ncbi:hypothetical protein FVEN_g11117 [Fusarium venenatum]|nr:hypothetical protein FVEN_g11117 [Fusarium venenatum]